jgi:hypothetical protein
MAILTGTLTPPASLSALLIRVRIAPTLLPPFSLKSIRIGILIPDAEYRWRVCSAPPPGFSFASILILTVRGAAALRAFSSLLAASTFDLMSPVSRASRTLIASIVWSGITASVR